MFKRYVLIALLGLFPAIAYSQQSDDTTRDLWDTAFMHKRPVGKKQVRRTQPIVRYKTVGKKPSSFSNDTINDSAVVGVTVWRLRPSKKTDDEEVRQLVHEQEWTPERVTAGAPLTEGSRVQLSIESPRAGYLYVFDREVYADKTFGEPYLIFPALDLNGGDNKVSAGKVVEIPSAEDKPSYYTLKRSRADHDGEALTVIVSDKPLSDVTIGRTASKISARQFNSYEKQWGAMTQQLELESGAGVAMSKAEKAAAMGQGPLTQDDSPPQTIYRVLAKPNQPLLLTIPLTIGSQSSKADRKPGL